MLTHIVMWKFLPEADGRTKSENMALVRAKLEALRPLIPQIRSIELHEDIGADQEPFDMILISRFDDAEALYTYQHHPAHKQVAAFVAGVRSGRAAVDFTD